MSAIDNGGPAFPTVMIGKPEGGMTLRDWFAGQALAGMMAYYNPTRGDFHTNCDVSGVAKTAFCFADFMIAARKESA